MIRQDDELDPTERAWIRRIPVTTLAMDGGSHVYVIVQPFGYGRAMPWTALLLGLLVVDVAKAAVVARATRPLLLPRLAVDLVQAVACGIAINHTGGHLGAIAFAGLPLAFELGIRAGSRGMLVPVAYVAVAVVALHGPGQQGLLTYVTSFTLAAGMGWSISHYGRRREQQFLAEHERTIEARATAAWLAVHNKLLTDAGSAADLLQRTATLVELARGPSKVRRETAERKHALGIAVRDRAAYLADVLLGWQAWHNQQPDLTMVVALEVRSEDRTALLTRGQAGDLWLRLSDLGLRGRTRVRFESGSSRPELDRVLVVGPHRVPILATRERVRRLVNGAPVIIGLLGLWTLGTVVYGMTDLVVAGPFALAAIVLARRAHRLLNDHDAAGRVWWETFALGTAFTAASGPLSLRVADLDGQRLYPALLPLQFLALLACVVWPWLTPADRRRAVLAGAALWLFVGAATGLPFHLRLFVGESVLPLSMLLSFAGVGTDLHSVSEAERARLWRQDLDRLTAVRADAAKTVIDDLHAARDDLAGELDGHERWLDPDVGAEARRRLADIDSELARLSSTTMTAATGSPDDGAPPGPRS